MALSLPAVSLSNPSKGQFDTVFNCGYRSNGKIGDF
jgi:hypothetical protein